MVELYIEQIKNGAMTIEQVPEMWREAVNLAITGAEQP